MSTPVERTSACASFTEWAERYRGMAVDRVDGNDVLAVRERFGPLAERARAGGGPALLECLTYRQSGHSKSDARVYRTRDEEARWAERDPLRVLAARAGLDEAACAPARAEVEDELEAAVRFALESPAGDLALALSDLEVLPPAPGPAPMDVGEGQELSLTEALRETLRGELRRDPATLLVGEDIGVYGGAFGVTRGLLEEFGAERVRETPISESSFVGTSVGASAGGLRPVCELMFGDFLACCMDSLVNHGAKFRYMYADTIRTPFTLRLPVGRRRGYGGTHSQSLEAWLTHVPGLIVLFPATVEDAVGLLRAAIRSDSPVCFLEHKLLYPARGRMPAADHVVPIGEARVDREGGDLTLVTYGNGLGLAREAARMLAGRGHEAEILDLRSLAPYDREAVLRSVQKTGRLLFVQEAVGDGGFCDRVLADLGPEAFPWLRAPLTKVAGLACPMPSSPDLEELVVPDVRAVLRAAVELLERY
ncbi:MAG: transketolase C-terminal domain-containing protein [Planctomycetota bacterium]